MMGETMKLIFGADPCVAPWRTPPVSERFLLTYEIK